jgi:hypothetical protein
MYHQLASLFLPVISAVWPRFNPLIVAQTVSGPRRQLTATLFGQAMGMVGVPVGAGVGGALGGGEVGVSNGAEGPVGVADGAPGGFTPARGQLHATTRAPARNKRVDRRFLMCSPELQFIPSREHWQ